MFGIGMPELILILVVALVVIGPQKLPDLAKAMGRALGEFKKATTDLKESLGVDQELQDVKKAFDDINKDLRETVTTAARKPADAPPPADPDPPQPSNAPMDEVKKAFDELNTDEKRQNASTQSPTADTKKQESTS